MKKVGLLTVVLIYFSFVLCGCSRNQYDIKYHDGYDSGYQDGYDLGYDDGYFYGLEEGLNKKNYEEEYLEFQSTIVTLMYDYEYETVEKLFEYYPEAVGLFLEQEFGTADMPKIIDYLESERTLYPDSIVGKCKYCGEDVCHKDAVHWVTVKDEIYEYNCAHKNCFDENKPKTGK